MKVCVWMRVGGVYECVNVDVGVGECMSVYE